MTSGAAPPRFSAVLFDVDGVLVSTEDAVLDLWAEVCRVAGRAAPEGESRGHIIGCSPEHTARHLFPGADAATVADLLTLVQRLEADLAMQAVPGAGDLVRDLFRAGVPIALVTGASAGRLARAVQMLGLTDEVAATVTWGEARGKPHPDAYQLAARRLRFDAAACVAVEDAPSGVMSAVSAGATCIGLAPPGSPHRASLDAAGAATVVGTLHELRIHLPGSISTTRGIA